MELSQQFHAVVSSARWGCAFESTSCDEAFLVVTEHVQHRHSSGASADAGAGARRPLPTPEAHVAALRKAVFDATGLVASAGIGKNKLLARLATDSAKPAGCKSLLEAEDAEAMLLGMNVRDIPQIGYKTAMELKTVFGTPVETVAELRQVNLASLQKEFGSKRGQTLHEYAFGIDHRKVENVPRQNISVEMSFGVRTKTEGDVKRWIGDLATEAYGRMQEAGFRAGKVKLRLYKAEDRQFTKDFVPWKLNGHAGESAHRSTSLNVLNDTVTGSTPPTHPPLLASSLRVRSRSTFWGVLTCAHV